jgi:uncharacterized protein (DUF2141 family)
MMNKLVTLSLLLPIMVCSQNKLSITVEGVKTSNGKISVALYDRSEGFLKFDKVFKADSIKARKGVTSIEIHDLPGGEYALAVFHDENGNDELDTNWLGIPTESVGFSRARMKAFGPPSFRECALQVYSDSEVRVVF